MICDVVTEVVPPSLVAVHVRVVPLVSVIVRSAVSTHEGLHETGLSGSVQVQLIVTVLRSRLTAFDTRAVDWPRVAEVAQGLSQADIVRAAEDAAKSAVLDDAAGMDTERLMRAVNERRRTGAVEDLRP